MKYSFCPKCGGPLKQAEHNLYICDKCDYHFYQNAKPCNSVIFTNNKGEILLVKRKFEPQKGKWDLPGGFVDLGESFEESVVREMKEELGLDMHHKDFTYQHSYPDTYEYLGVMEATLVNAYTALLPDGVNIHPSDDAEDPTWFSKESVPYKDLSFPSMKKAIEDYFRLVK